MALLNVSRIKVYQRASISFRQYVSTDFIEGMSKRKFSSHSHLQPLLMKRGCHVSSTNVSNSTPHGQPIGIISSSSTRVKMISKSMKAYLERAIQHESFIKEKNEEFEIGKRHLANMMGVDAANLTQQDIDKAIEYLLPSGLYDKKARPKMKPPEEMYPKQKAAQFDTSGRPFSAFFYTTKANFYEILHKTVEKFKELDAFEDKMLRRGIKEPPKESALCLSGSEWLNINEIKSLVLENVSEKDYNFLIETLNRLSIHPYSFRCKEHIFKFRKIFEDVISSEDIPSLTIGDDERESITFTSKRKRATAKVTVWKNGTGIIKINEMDLRYFEHLKEREQILYPLNFTGLLGSVDVEAEVESGGISSQAGAIRHALSLALRSFVTTDLVEKMRLVGLLTKDKRRRERKKPGQKGARAKFTWVKR